VEDPSNGREVRMRWVNTAEIDGRRGPCRPRKYLCLGEAQKGVTALRAKLGVQKRLEPSGGTSRHRASCCTP
jgi:hypothetical protein